MKRYILFPILLLNINFVFADNMWISLKDSVQYSNPGDIHVFEAYINNTSQNAILVKAIRAINELPNDWTTSMCIGSTCYHYLANETDLVGINPADSAFFDITFSTDAIPGTGKALVVFEEFLSGERDSVYFSLSTLPTFELLYTDTLVQAETGAEVIFGGKIKNISKRSRGFALNRISNELSAGWGSALGLNNDFASDESDSLFIQLAAGDSADYNIRFTTDQVLAGSSSVTIAISDTALNYSETVHYTVESFASGPSYSISVLDSSDNIPAGSIRELGGFAYNLTDEPIMLTMVREIGNLPQGWSTSLCFGSCFSSIEDTVDVQIGAGDSLAYSITFVTDSLAGMGTASLKFFVAGEQDTTVHNFSIETTATDIAKKSNLAEITTFRLLGNYPNPFNPGTVIKYQLSRSEFVELGVFNTLGKKVATLISQKQNAGLHAIRFDAPDLSSGTYLYRLKAGKQVLTGKMLLLK